MNGEAAIELLKQVRAATSVEDLKELLVELIYELWEET